MKAVFIAVTILVHCLEQKCIFGQEPVCQSQSSCSECITSPGCAWCTQTDFLKSGESNERRCDSLKSLKDRNCKEDHVINPENGSLTHLKNKELSSSHEDVVQLKPQNINITLRVGVPYEFTVEFKRAHQYPIDLYYLMDLSYSMKDDLEQIKTLGQKILKKLKEITQTVRIGFGSFVDKQLLPYVSQVKARVANPCPSRKYNCQPAFSFQNFLPLTSIASEFEEKVSKQKISGNLDSPEAGLDAITQAAVCKEQIEWGNVTRILVYTSDDTFHMAGDGRLGGVFEPHNGECHLNKNGSYDGRAYDYPSVGLVSRVLQDNNIQLIFAVTEDIYPAYKALSALIPQSVVGVLKNDSSNVVDLISEAYGNLSSTLVLEQEGAPEELNVFYKSICKDNQEDKEWKEKGECQGIKHEKVTFQVRLNASKCLDGPRTFRIKMQGITEEVKITVHTECQCDCGAPEVASEHCSDRGNLSCGMCSCDSGYIGQNCGCVQQSDMDSTVKMQASCRPNNRSLEDCNGHGYCECGKCSCAGLYSGQFCECDPNSCENHNGKSCNDQGRCNCGKCECKGNYTGTACQCSPSQEKCESEKGLCSGHGQCICNKCQCDEIFKGVEDCSKLNADCTNFKECVACHLDLGTKHNCTTSCFNAEVNHLDGTHELRCTYEDTISYEMELNANNKIVLRYADLPHSIDKTTVIIGSSVSGIIFIGIIIIIIYRALLELYDIREYHNFVKAQKQTEWKETQNPLFKGATTTVFNPLHNENEDSA